jgi:hypothetical protein
LTIRSVVIPAFQHFWTRRNLLVWLLVSGAATLMAPFDSDGNFPLPLLALYWAGVVGMALLFSAVVSEGVARVAPDRLSWRFGLLRVLGMSLVFTPVLVLWTVLLAPMPQMLPSVWRMAVFVAMTGVTIHALRRILGGDVDRFIADDAGSVALASQATDQTPKQPQPRLMRRLPDDAVGPILRLSASDHMVEVHLPDASHSLRMRFVDAIAEMDGVPGDCAHRSHWVTFAAVTGVKRDKGRILLLISNGDEVPVSRTYRPRIEAAGLLDP